MVTSLKSGFDSGSLSVINTKMPKDSRRRPKKQSSSDSDSGPEDKGPAPRAEPPAKKAKSSTSAVPSDELSWNLGQRRFVKLTQFKGKWYVHLREFYVADSGDMRPGRKGIMLTMQQWAKFCESIPELQDAIKTII